MPEKRWNAGDTAVLRYVDERRQSVSHAWPCRVIVDSAELVAPYVPNGVDYKLGRRVDGLAPMPLGEYVVRDAVWGRDCLRLMFPGAWHSVWLLWEVNPRRLVCWYVNMEFPFVRTPMGFDTDDLELDVVVNPDFTWRLKDEDHLEQVVSAGFIGRERALALRQEAELVIRAATSSMPPFDGGWDLWTPDPSWSRPVLNPEWPVL